MGSFGYWRVSRWDGPAVVRWGMGTMLIVLGCTIVGGCQGQTGQTEQTEQTEAAYTRLTMANFEKIRVGMHHNELIEILGEPKDRLGPSANGSFSWVWADGDREIAVTIQVDGTVMGLGSRAAKYGTNLE